MAQVVVCRSGAPQAVTRMQAWLDAAATPSRVVGALRPERIPNAKQIGEQTRPRTASRKRTEGGIEQFPTMSRLGLRAPDAPERTPPLERPAADDPERHRPVLALDSAALGQDAAELFPMPLASIRLSPARTESSWPRAHP